MKITKYECAVFGFVAGLAVSALIATLAVLTFA